MRNDLRSCCLENAIERNEENVVMDGMKNKKTQQLQEQNVKKDER